MKNILVTGAGGGMGQAVVDLFAARGYRVFALDKNSVQARDNVIPVTVDLTDEKSVAAAYAAVCAEAGELCGIVHLAGVYLLNSLIEMPPDEFSFAFRINLGGAFLINRTFLPLLKPGAKIITVTSELAVRDPLPFTGIYAITKTALDSYSYSLRMELQLLGINVSVLRAGAVDTGMLGDSTEKLDKFCRGTGLYACNAKRFKNIVDRVEARRVPPSAIAEKIYRIENSKRPRFAYSLNRNPLLIMLDVLPKKFRFFIIRKILTGKQDIF